MIGPSLLVTNKLAYRQSALYISADLHN